MPPGPKKNRSSRKPVDDRKREPRSEKLENTTLSNQRSDHEMPSNDENVYNSLGSENRKYQKREIVSNSDRYQEPVEDTHADTKRGHDYEVLLSYSGGAGSQYRFVEERDWEEKGSGDNDDMHLTLDLNYLSKSLKCIPFHERLHLGKDIFEQIQINKMVSASKQSRLSLPPLKNKYENISQRVELPVPDLMPLDQDSTFVFKVAEEDEIDTVVDSKIPASNFPVSADTENLIASLGSRLTFEKETLTTPKKAFQPESPKPVAKDDVTDDLDFLLSLSISGLPTVPEQSDKTKSGITDANVDDWLSSVLDH